ncbi:hypothetical protein GF378_02410 [Candidatus Pacearchaeota archaeon]|nr:hypothetical protein [Candidatus Pacearchaeota archaeon]
MKYHKQDSVFFKLKDLREQGKSFMNLAKDPDSERFSLEIEDAFEKNGYQLSDSKKELALDWFLAEYICSTRNFNRFYNFIENLEEESGIYDFESDLRNCHEMFNRAFKSVERCHRVCQEPYNILLSRPRKLVEDELKQMKKKVYFATEFPNTFSKIKRENRRKNDAIKSERFELASILTRRINKISDNNLDYQKDIENVYKGDRRFWK